MVTKSVATGTMPGARSLSSLFDNLGRRRRCGNVNEVYE